MVASIRSKNQKKIDINSECVSQGGNLAIVNGVFRTSPTVSTTRICVIYLCVCSSDTDTNGTNDSGENYL